MTANPGKPGLNRARARGGRASPNEQQSLSFEPLRATADRDQLRNPSQRTDVEAARGAPLTATFAAPKARTDEETSTMATMTMTMTATHTKDSTPTPLISAVIACLNVSFDSVAANRGAPGPDRVTIDQLRKHWPAVINDLGNSLADGTYRVGDIRRVWIPKASGGQRALGIPNVIDRVVQEAVRRTIEPIFEPTFHESSHGFRPGRSCHTAVAQARQHLEEGHEWVVDLDLEKFFDSVHHQRLLARIGLRVNDPALLALINQMLRAKVVLPDGVVINNEEGVPQGGPLSPLLSNIVLSELDEELAQREHRFVRYADDCNIYVRSERAGQRVMESVTRFIERRMRLKVNRGKSAVALAGDRHFVGFRIMRNAEDGTTEVIPSQRSVTRLYARVKELTPRNWGGPLAVMIAAVNSYLRGWLGFFGICTARVKWTVKKVDSHLRRRLRAVKLKQHRRRRTISRKLEERGVKRATAWKVVYAGNKSTWALSGERAVERAYDNAYFAELGLTSLAARWSIEVVAPLFASRNPGNRAWPKTGRASGS